MSMAIPNNRIAGLYHERQHLSRPLDENNERIKQERVRVASNV